MPKIVFIKEGVKNDEKVSNEEPVRNEMFLALGYYVTESSGHNSEYNWWFRKRPDLIEKYCTTGTGWNPGHHAFILNEYLHAEKTWKQEFLDWLNSDNPISLERRHEYAAYIINAYLGGELYEFNGNVPNTGLVTNLPRGACVEVPVLASRKGFEPIHVGLLPDSCAILTNLAAQTEMMAVEGFFQGDAMMIYQAIAHDPLTAAKLSLAETKNMVREIFEQNRKYLPQFEKIRL